MLSERSPLDKFPLCINAPYWIDLRSVLNTLQDDHSGSSQPPGDMKTNVAFQYMPLIHTKTQIVFQSQQEVRSYLNGTL